MTKHIQYLSCQFSKHQKKNTVREITNQKCETINQIESSISWSSGRVAAIDTHFGRCHLSQTLLEELCIGRGMIHILWKRPTVSYSYHTIRIHLDIKCFQMHFLKVWHSTWITQILYKNWMHKETCRSNGSVQNVNKNHRPLRSAGLPPEDSMGIGASEAEAADMNDALWVVVVVQLTVEDRHETCRCLFKRHVLHGRCLEVAWNWPICVL